MSAMSSGSISFGPLSSGSVASGAIGLSPQQKSTHFYRDDAQTFLFEMLACLMRSHTEIALMQALQKNPTDKDTRRAYVDFLLENGRAESAELVRAGYTPGVVLQRMRSRMAELMIPPTPSVLPNPEDTTEELGV